MTNVLSTFVKCVCVNSYDVVHVFCNVNQDGGLLNITSKYRFLGPKKGSA